MASMTVESAKQAVAEKHGYVSWRVFLKKCLFAQEENGNEKHEMETEVFAIIDAEIARLTAELEKYRWIPVGERLPEPETKVLACHQIDEWQEMCFISISRRWFNYWDVDAVECFPTHWRYLTEMP